MTGTLAVPFRVPPAGQSEAGDGARVIRQPELQRRPRAVDS